MGNFQIKPLVDTVTKALGNVGKISSASARVGAQSGKASAQSVKNTNRAKQATSLVSNQQKLGIAQTGASSAWAVATFILATFLFVLVPLIKTVAEKWGRAARGTIGEMIETTNPGAGESKFVRVPTAIFRILLYAAWIFLDRLFIPFFKNAYFIVGYALVAAVLIYVGERHPDTTISVFSELADVGVAGANVLGYMLQALVELENLTSPITNMLVRFQFYVMMTIYDGVQATIAGATTFQQAFGRRRLESQLGMDGLFETFSDIIVLAGHMYNALLTFTTTVIRLLFDLGIVPFIRTISQYIVAGVIKLTCAFAGTYCTFAEIFAFAVDGIVGLFGGLIPAVTGLACSAEVLTAMHVGSSCAGGLASLEPPGLFRNAETAKRRSTMECLERGGMWYEQIDGVVHDANDNSSAACPLTRGSLTPLGHALNLKLLDTHDCYHVCVGEVEYRQCADEVRVLVGSCGGREYNWTRMEAARRLNSIFTAPTATTPIWLGLDASTRRRLGLASFSFEAVAPQSSPLTPGNTRGENVNALRSAIGSMTFAAQFGGCDLTKDTTDIFEILYDGGCVLTRLMSRGGGQAGRRRLEESAGRLEWADGLRHDMRIMDARLQQVGRDEDHPLLKASATSAAGSLFFAMGRLAQTCPEGLRRCPPSLRCVAQCPTARRRLDAQCEDDKFLCPNEIECVDALTECYDATSYSAIGALRMVIMQLAAMFKSLDVGGYLDTVADCWRNYLTNPEMDPYYGMNLEAPIDDLRTRCVWCPPMWAPLDWEFSPWTYSLRGELNAACAGMSADFVGCRCPMFYPLPSATLKVGANLSLDLGFILANGLIWFKNIFAYLTGDVVGYVWSGVFPAYIWPVWWTHAFTRYRTSGDVYLVCYITHAGSAMLLALTLTLAFTCARVVVDILWMCWRGGKLAPRADAERMELAIKKNEDSIAKLERRLGSWKYGKV